LLCGCGGGTVGLRGCRGGFGGLLAGIGGLFIGRRYLPVQITDGLVSLLVVTFGLCLQRTQLCLSLIGLVLDGRDSFTDVLFRSAAYTTDRHYPQNP
jgi:hypothetical protein